MLLSERRRLVKVVRALGWSGENNKNTNSDNFSPSPRPSARRRPRRAPSPGCCSPGPLSLDSASRPASGWLADWLVASGRQLPGRARGMLARGANEQREQVVVSARSGCLRRQRRQTRPSAPSSKTPAGRSRHWRGLEVDSGQRAVRSRIGNAPLSLVVADRLREGCELKVKAERGGDLATLID